MLRYLFGDELNDHPQLRDTMFRDRTTQFRDRLGWEVSVDADGFERDEYDDLNPLYVIWQRPDGRHGGSARFLPTIGSTMVEDHFSHIADIAHLKSPFIWECTRFCLSPDADSQVAGLLMLGGGELMRGFSVEHFLGVFDARMIRIYRMIGASPEVLGSQGEGRDRISVGLWSFTMEDRDQVLQRAGVSSELSEHWFEQHFGQNSLTALTA
ncbi:acyl-homoserine-lactone synthase [Aestuariibius sp. 2305UL40-4]|uniref:acyl-homoserine-lactone synthase n=1 Tax=Aestuariibius violaceus TaxID=3234132 RepID=UPI00345E280B